jgi:hypothetical protein
LDDLEQQLQNNLWHGNCNNLFEQVQTDELRNFGGTFHNLLSDEHQTEETCFSREGEESLSPASLSGV